jgi:hypothetical protein
MDKPKPKWQSRDWIIATTLSLPGSLLIGITVFSLVLNHSDSDPSSPLANMISWLLCWAVIGMLLGGMQQLMLTRWGYFIQFWPLTYMVGAPFGTFVGGLSGYFVAFVASLLIGSDPNGVAIVELGIIGGTVAGATTGVVVGVLQSRLLAPLGYDFSDWMIKTGLAWTAAGAILGCGVGLHLLIQLEGFWIILVLVFGLPAGAVCGKVTSDEWLKVVERHRNTAKDLLDRLEFP